MLVVQEPMYHRTGQRWLKSTYSTAEEGKVLFSTIAKPGMFGLEMRPKENFLAYSTQFIFLIIRLVTGNVVMAVIDVCWKKPYHGRVDILNYLKTCISFYVFRLSIHFSV